MTIAIDGPAGVGKSTIAHRIALNFGYFNINSGNFYRAITYEVLKARLNPEDGESVFALAKPLKFTLQNDRLHVNGEDVEGFLHTDQVDAWAAQVSSHPPIREIVNRNLRGIASSHDVVMEGRDITTVVFPQADLKIFLDASIEARAMRRFRQGITNQSLEDLKRSIAHRDNIDRNKPQGALQIADDAFYLDTSGLTIEEVYAKVVLRMRGIE